MSSYNAPPAYQSKTYGTNDSAAADPLLGRAGPSNGIYNQPDPGDLPDDFKVGLFLVLYGVNVTESAPEIRNAFVRKVYTILFCQILLTTIVGGYMSRNFEAVFWVQTHSWSLFVGLGATLVNLGLLFWKRHSHPINLVLLTTFTLLEASTIGVCVAFVNNQIILQALLITLGVFLGLTLFTIQSKWDFSGMGPFLFAGLIALLMTGLVGMFIPFGKTMDLIYAVLGTLLFSGYVVYDTFQICNRLSPDEYIMGAISLYLDFINLFLMILRVLNNTQSD
ncbi:UPF0005-domain-containing protein [Sistotremastrum niveocremeum HHB9708]|uniref:UPF0005-domain-containing protein n=1 Tax=Sistotremastrum niveocremeum HHB9708 TaxID=1314777 RepID=A0A164V8Y4_9AGAM|nr:UPF0005-domain-containing protein [Sistotremastrum niveocremeum HHB9708]